MKRVTTCILSLLFALLFTNQSFAQDSVQAITAALKKHSLPIQSIEPTYNFSDLQPFKSILNEVNGIDLGEATHGTREFYQMKHRLLRFLVQEMNFTALLKNFETRALKGLYDSIIYRTFQPGTAYKKCDRAKYKQNWILAIQSHITNQTFIDG